MKHKLLATLAWLQLITSLLLVAAIIWGYTTYQASFGQFVHSVAASIGAVSTVVVRTAETVEARRDLLNETAQMLVVTRKIITELRVSAENQAKLAPQYADGARSASAVAGNLSNTLKSIGDGLLLIPTLPGVSVERWKPSITASRPLDVPAQKLIQNAQDLRIISDSLAGVATSIGRDGKKLGEAISTTSDQAIRVLTAAEKTLARLNTQELPKALEDLRMTSKNLSYISAQVDIVGNVGLVLCVVGLLLAVWCFLSSLSAISLANTNTTSRVTG